MKRKKTILLYSALALVVVALASYFIFPNKPQAYEGGCLYAVVRARHPILSFIQDEFGDGCMIPKGWIIIRQ